MNHCPVLTIQKGGNPTLMTIAFGQKRKSGDVAGEADARGDDDIAHRSAAAEPFTGMGGKVFEVHAPSAADGSVSASLI